MPEYFVATLRQPQRPPVSGRQRRREPCPSHDRSLEGTNDVMTNPAFPSSQAAAARRIAEAIHRGFDRYHGGFLAITRRARGRFETADWSGAQADARERLDLYPLVLREVVAELTAALGPAAREELVWAAGRAQYSEAIAGHGAGEIAETFFNSVTRRVLGTVGVNSAVEFLDFQFDRVHGAPAPEVLRAYPVTGGNLAPAVRAVLEGLGFTARFEDSARDAELVAQRIAEHWVAGGAPAPVRELLMLAPVFYRRKGAYVVGRVVGGNRAMPLVLPLAQGPAGIRVDAVLPAEDDVSILFSFTRSHFHADVPNPSAVIGFLHALMPLKPVAELYAALGYDRHGKTELYRDLQRHLHRTGERFDVAPGAPGMVMVVFAMPGYDVVFKVIRDSFAPPKQTTPDAVKRRYQLVFAHDRAGRLLDTQEFEGLSFPRARFTPRLLAELREAATRAVRRTDESVSIAHLYTERRVRPLDLYLAEAGPAEARRAVLDCGRAVRDLAATNVFPGDILPKNFGVTRHGRVVFYDYDELRLLGECRFRAMPEARYPEDELSDEPWFHVGPDDVFPEELGRFVPFTGGLRDAFLEAHGSLYTVGFWQDLQTRNAAGEIVDVYPYADERRLHR
jgi:isocitrate dehydrogenase kinase/phosphatase